MNDGVDVEARLRSRLAAEVGEVVEGAHRPPVSAVRDGARRRRRRRTRAVAATLVTVAVVCAGTAVWLVRTGDRRVASTDAVTPRTPADSRLFPTDTNGGEIDVFQRGPATSGLWPRPVVTQFWTVDDRVELAIRSENSGGFSARYGQPEHVTVSGWPDASLAQADDGLISLYLVHPDLSISHVATRSLDPSQLIALAGSLEPAADGRGLTLAADAVPTGWVESPTDVFEASAPITFVFSAIGTQRTTFRLSTQSEAEREFDRFAEPPTTVRVHEHVADVRTDEQQTSITWTPLPDVTATVTAHAPPDVGVALVQRIADSVTQIDETAWRALLDTDTTPIDIDGTVATNTTLAPQSFCANAPDVLADSELQYSSPNMPDLMPGFDDVAAADQAALRSAVRTIVSDAGDDGPDHTQWTDEPIIDVVNRMCGLELHSSERVS